MTYIEFEVDDKVDEELFFERMDDLLIAVEDFNKLERGDTFLDYVIYRERVLKAANAFAQVFDSSIEL